MKKIQIGLLLPIFLLFLITIVAWYNFQKPEGINTESENSTTDTIKNVAPIQDVVPKLQLPQELPKFDVDKFKMLLKDAIAYSNAEEYETVLSSLNQASNLENISQDFKKSIQKIELHINKKEIKIAISEIEKIITQIDKPN